MSNRVIIERNKRFAESHLFEMQRSYFKQKGVHAWVEEVPFYATSNPFLANCYAQMTMRLIQDWVRKHPESRNETFYILELGTGTGILSFFISKKIKQLRKRLQLEDVNICYVMSDYAESNLEFWDKHPALQEFVAAGALDFALFNMESDTTIQLRKSGKTLTPGSVNTPMVIYANYIFDTVSQDAFAKKDGELFASLVTLSTHSGNMKDNQPINMEEVKIEYSKGEVEKNYYPDADFNAVLDFYRESDLRSSYFLFPTAGLITMANLRKISNDKLFVLSTDKAYSYLQQLEGLDHPDIAFHGSFSTMVNFHAISKYFDVIGGQSVLQTQRAEVNTAAFYCGFSLEDLPELSIAVNEHIERLSPGDYFALHRNIRENFKHCNINTLAAHMAFAEWDPHIYGKISKQICSLINDAEYETKIYLTSHMPDLAANYYYIPRNFDVWFDIGILFHTLRRYADAIPYYKKSMHFFGEQFNTLYNLAICEYNAKYINDALADFKRALVINEDSKEAREWIDFILKENSAPKQD